MRNARNRLFRTISAVSLSIALILSATACSNTPARDTDTQFPSNVQSEAEGSVVDLRPNSVNTDLDTRASASQTFGVPVLVNVQAQSEQVNAGEVLDLTPGDTIMSLSEFMIAFNSAKGEFEKHLGSALTQAGLQTSYENEVIRLDTLGIADLFMVFAVWEQGPDAILSLWQSAVGVGDWTLDVTEEDEWVHLLFSKDGVPTAEFFSSWYEGDQYLYCIFNTPDYELEMDIARTEYGFACQLYEPGTPAIYRFSFSDIGIWDSSIGCSFAITEQPDFLTGLETLAYAKDWPDFAASGDQPTYVLIEGNTLTISQNGAETNYTIDTGTAATVAPGSTENNPENNSSGGETDYQNAAVTITQDVEANASQSALSAEAESYSRLWHGSSVLGSGWSERFALYEDGSFIWGANEMDGATRLRYLAGTWNVENSELTLNAKLVIAWEGGEVVPNTGIASYGSDEVILNPTVVVGQIDEPLILPVSQVTHDNERNLDTVTFYELQCWDYSGQADDAMNGFWQSFMTSWNRAPEPKDKTMPVSGIK